jgi:hypothetical protein
MLARVDGLIGYEFGGRARTTPGDRLGYMQAQHRLQP